MDGDPNDKKPAALLNIIKKQCRLAFIVYGTSFLLFALLANVVSEQGIVQSFGYIDTIINGLCVYCTFDFKLNHLCYRYLCNCNGVRPCQWMFCFLCCCCNTHEKKTDESKLAEMQSNGSQPEPQKNKVSQGKVSLSLEVPKENETNRNSNSESGSIPTVPSVEIVYNQ